LEIYNEIVRDLLVPGSVALRVREHPQRGVFVENLTVLRVTSFEQVLTLIATGERNRIYGATEANMHSSRSHVIVTLTVVRRSRQHNSSSPHGLPTSALHKREGRMHLVDLAGSERVANTGAKGQRLKEASSINRSLSVLGDVILSLASGKRGHIPYRNSVLTTVLRDSLGGTHTQ
jgi:kinesin family protein 3/17